MSSRADMTRGQRAGFGVISTVLVAAVITLIVAYGNGHFDDGYRLTAVFPTASQGLFTDGGTDVKLRGMNVGTVEAIEVLDDGRAEITLFIDPGVAIPESAMASIEPLSIFGPKFIRIEPGELEATGPYLADGDEISEARTGAELTRIIDETTDLLARIDPNELLAVTEAVSSGVSGLGDELGTTIDSAGTLGGVAARHAADVRTFLTDLAALSGTFADHTGDFLASVAQVNRLLPTINEHQADIDQLLDVTTQISTTFSGLLERHGPDFGATVNALADFIHGVYEESEKLPDVLDLVGTYFGRLADIMRFAGPPGTDTTMAGLRGFLALDLCLLAGICPDGAP